MNVKRIFFLEGATTPSYEMEDGSVKHPYKFGWVIHWITFEKWVEINEDINKNNKWWKFW